ncbi:MAG: NFACT RNA binding domain-containing protein [Eubacteriales bacterium]
MKFITSDGFTVLVGRNNRQNDKLTLKDANNHDMWLHVKNIPGSHTIIVFAPQGNYRTSHFGSCADCSLLQQGKRFITGSC